MEVTMKMRVFWILLVSLVFSGGASSQCIRQSMSNHDYCGPEGRSISGLIPDSALGNFKGACARHDQCYSFGASNVVREMEKKYRMSMLSADKEKKKEFKNRMNEVRRACDESFRGNLESSCDVGNKNCRKAANIYYSSVSKLGHKWFEKAVDGAFTCRL
jgi:hypothetical protein